MRKKPNLLCSLLLIAILSVSCHLNRTDKETGTKPIPKPVAEMDAAGTPTIKSNYRRCLSYFVIEQLKIPVAIFKNGDTSIESKAIHLSKEGNSYKIKVPYGAKYFVVLPNGTKVWLNSNTILSVDPSSWTSIKLSGEGYFQFIHNSVVSPGKNIFIEADSGCGINMTCYRDYPNEPLLSTTLINGNNAVIKSGKVSVLLSKPGQTISVLKSFNVFGRGEQRPEEAIFWTKEEFICESINHPLLLNRIGRWYKVNIDFPNSPHYEPVSYAGTFAWTLDGTIENLNLQYPKYRYTVEGQKIKVRKL